MTSWIRHDGQTYTDFLEEQTKDLLLNISLVPNNHSSNLIPMGAPIVIRRVGYFYYVVRHFFRYEGPTLTTVSNIETVSKFGLMASPVGADIIIEYPQRSKLFQ